MAVVYEDLWQEVVDKGNPYREDSYQALVDALAGDGKIGMAIQTGYAWCEYARTELWSSELMRATMHTARMLRAFDRPQIAIDIIDEALLHWGPLCEPDDLANLNLQKSFNYEALGDQVSRAACLRICVDHFEAGTMFHTWSLRHLGDALLYTADFTEAESLLNRAFESALELKDVRLNANVRLSFARLFQLAGDLELAFEHGSAAYRLCEFTGNQLDLAEAALLTGHIAFARDLAADAERYFDTAIANRERAGFEQFAAEAMHAKARLYSKLGRTNEAQQLFSSAKPVLEAVGLGHLALDVNASPRKAA